MRERLTWEEIMEKYPDQWLGMEDVEWENESNIASAIVVDSISSMSELTEKQISSGGKFVARYTTPDNSLYINTLGCSSGICKGGVL